MKICIVSPHLDDAILSCGILMQRRRTAGDEVIALNIFTAGTNAEIRRKEEQNAEAKLGATPYFLDELDAPDRNPLYKSEVKLFHGDFKDVPEEFIAKVTKRVSDFFTAHKIDEAYFPLAAGTHIDHRIAHAVGRRIKDIPVRFYEDRPYIIWPGVLLGRMNGIGSDAILPQVTEQMMIDLLPSYYYLKYFVPEGIFRKESLPLYFAALKRPDAPTLKSSSETLAPATPEELRTLYDSLALYTSQMKSIYSGYENFIHDNMSYEKFNSGREVYAERYWTFA